MPSPGLPADPGAARGGPLQSRPYVVVSELPAAMAIPGGRNAGFWPLIQFIKDWNNQPESRALMLAGGLPEDTEATTAAKIAAVVHALCQRDGHRVPEWVHSKRSNVDVPLIPHVDLKSPHGQRLRQNAPGVCHYHRVYFAPVDLRST